MRPEYNRLIGLQGAITITGATVAYFLVSPLAAKSVAFGGGIALTSVLLIVWRFRQADRKVDASAEWLVRQAYRTLLERLVLVAFLFVLGMGILKLVPLWLLAGFVGAQLGWLVAPVWMRTKNEHGKRN
jgi:ATP synthase protein I